MDRKVKTLKLDEPIDYRSLTRTPGTPRTKTVTIKLDKSASDPGYLFFWIRGKYISKSLILAQSYTIIKNNTVYTVDIIAKHDAPFMEDVGTIEVQQWSSHTDLVKDVREKLKKFVQ